MTHYKDYARLTRKTKSNGDFANLQRILFPQKIQKGKVETEVVKVPVVRKPGSSKKSPIVRLPSLPPEIVELQNKEQPQPQEYEKTTNATF